MPASAVTMEHRRFPAWAFSLLFHFVLLTAIGWSVQRASRGTDAPVDREIGVAIVHRQPDRDVYSDPITRPSNESAASQDNASSSSASASSIAPANVAPPIDLDGILAEMTAGDAPAIKSGDIGDAFGEGADASGQSKSLGLGPSQTTAMVFGVSGSGSRFIYVFDRSDSMNGYGGKPLRAAKSELKRSLRTMSDAQQFQIIFYNDTAKPFIPAGSPLQMLSGEKTMTDRAIKYVDSVKAFGATEHYMALRTALRMGPDVIFFLTDARVPRLTATQFANIRDLADRCGASIHAIEFGSESFAPQDSFLRELASQNRGQYRYLSQEELAAIPAGDFDAPQEQP